MELAEACYRLTEALPHDERFGLASQLQRAAVSVPSNIAEGHGRMQRRAYANHASIARGSVLEVQTQLELAVRLGRLSREQVAETWRLADEVSRMLHSLIRRLRQSPSTE